MADGFETLGSGLVVPKEKKEPRKFAALRGVETSVGLILLAVSQDGAGFFKHPVNETWMQLPDLPGA